MTPVSDSPSLPRDDSSFARVPAVTDTRVTNAFLLQTHLCYMHVCYTYVLVIDTFVSQIHLCHK